MEKWCRYIRIGPGLEGWRRVTPFRSSRNLTRFTGMQPIHNFWSKTNQNPLKNHLLLLKKEQTNKRETTAFDQGNWIYSTFLSYLNIDAFAEKIMEPIEAWQNVNGVNLLQLVYSNPGKYSFTFQMFVLITMLQNHNKPYNKPIKILERSFTAAHTCFAELLTIQGHIRPEEHQVLKSWTNAMEKTGMVNVDLIIYLRTTPSTAFTRVQQRERKEESNLTLTYLEELHNLHEIWLHKNQVPLIVLTADGDMLQLLENVSLLEKIIRFLVNDY